LNRNLLAIGSFLSFQKQQKIQKDRLINDFTNALASFQQAQRDEKERERLCSVQTPANSGGASRVTACNQCSTINTYN